MKHIFFVHSHICYALSAAIIQHKGLIPSEVIFISDRKYDLPDIKKRGIPSPPESWFFFEKNFFKGWRNIQNFENYLRTICPTEFEYYCPHTLSPFSNFMADHPRCQAHYLIEEGSASYLTTDQINHIYQPRVLSWKQQLWSKAFYRNRFQLNSFFRTDTCAAYCTDKSTFPDMPNKVILPVDFSEIFEDPIALGEPVVLALDSAVETKYATPQSYMIGIQRLVEHFNQTAHTDTVLHVKLHPYQYVDRFFADQVITALRTDIGSTRVHELPPNAAIEAIKSTDGARLYVGISSLPIYASRSGIPCYSFAETIAMNDVKYRLRLEQQPSVFMNSVQFI